MTAMHPGWWYAWGGRNAAAFLWVNHLGSGWVWDHLALAGTAAGDHALYPVYAALALAVALKRPNALSSRAVLVFLCGYLLEWAAIASLKPWLDFPRPLEVLGPGSVHVLGAPELWHSFPSGHTAFAFLMLGSLAPGANWPLRIALGVFAVWVAWARMAVGAHFPADVLGSALIGLASAWLASRALALAGYAPGRR